MPDAEVLLLSKTLEPVEADTGLRLLPYATLRDCPPLDVICVPGGPGVNALMEDAEVLGWLRQRAGQARYVSSVCTGSLVLGAAGLLRGKRATSHWGARDLLAAFGAIPTAGSRGARRQSVHRRRRHRRHRFRADHGGGACRSRRRRRRFNCRSNMRRRRRSMPEPRNRRPAMWSPLHAHAAPTCAHSATPLLRE